MTKKKATPTNTAPAAEAKTLSDLIAEITDVQAAEQMKAIDKGFDDRAAFEATHNPANSSIQDKLKTYRKKLVLPGIAALTLATKVNPNFMNASGINANKRFNIYAIDKLADLLHGLNMGHIKNAVNKAIVQSMFKFQDAGVPFTAHAAQGAVSANLKVETGTAKLLVRHTAAPGTAPTQSSSTMNALMVLGAVKNIGSAKHPIYQLTDAPVVARLKEIAAAA